MHELLEEIDLNNSVILCGAGISRNSGLPTVFDFYEYLFFKLGCSKLDSKELAIDVIQKHLPFEHIVEILFQEIDSYQFLEIFKNGEPNTNHYFLAELFKKGLVNQIVTTNFDCLIEKALSENYPDFKYDKKFKELDFKQLEIKKQSMLKLHGSIEYKNFNELKATISKVANKKWLGIIGDTINYIFHDGPHENLIIIGYSFSDKFDINPHIFNKKKCLKNIYFINHSNVFSISNLNESDTIFKNKNFKGKVININTDIFIEYLWNKNIISRYPGALNSDSSWKEVMNNQFSKINTSLKKRILGLIFKELGDFDEAIRLLKNSQSILKEEGEGENFRIKGRNLLMLGNILDYKNELKEAKKCFNETLKIGQELSDQILIADTKFHLGRLYEKSERFDIALKYYKETLEIDLNELSKAKTHYQMGIVYQECNDLLSAEKMYHKALSVYTNKGDFKGVTKVNHQIGNIYFLQGEYNKSRHYYEQNIIDCDKIANIQDKGRSIYMMGLSEKYLGKLDVAEEMFRKSLVIKESFIDKKGIVMNFNQLGDVMLMKDNFEEALLFFDRAFEIANSNNINRGKSSSLLFKSNLYLKKRNYELSIKLAKESLVISLELNWNYQTIKVYKLLIDVYNQIGNKDVSTYYQEKLNNI